MSKSANFLKLHLVELGMHTGSSAFTFGQLWTCIMISIKAQRLCPTVMKETPVSEPPLQTTTTSSSRPPLAATAQVIKRSNLLKKRRKTPWPCIVWRVLLTFGVNCTSNVTANLHSASLDHFLTVSKVTLFDDLTKCVMAQKYENTGMAANSKSVVKDNWYFVSDFWPE